jgi:hypothetical protein
VIPGVSFFRSVVPAGFLFIKHFVTFLLLLWILISCNSTKNISGTYRTNFAEFGFFGTTIRLKQDSSLQYVFQGDLIYDSTTGLYSVHDRKVYITFDKEPPDTTKLYHRFDNIPLKTAVISDDTIHYQIFCYIGHKKLFSSHIETEKKVVKASGYNKRKKYFFFGSHYYKRRRYLKRVD